MKNNRWLPLVLGLLLLFVYWYSVRPLGRGYVEDWCGPDMTRQLLAEAVSKTGGPDFHSDSFMAPIGISLPYLGWEIEMSWLGSYFWNWAKDFPFLWFHFGLSLVVSYLGVGWILRRMKLGSWSAWAMAAAVVVFHVPRHFKTWHHASHLLQHWVYWAVFLDAWIWQRFVRENRWSWSLELWRAFLMLGMLTTVGIYWGPLVLEYALVRLCMVAWSWRRARQKAEPLVWDGSWREGWPTLLLGAVFFGLVLRWYLPLWRAVHELGSFEKQLSWFTKLPYVFRPLWLDLVAGRWISHKMTHPETVLTIGWVFWIPAVLGVFLAKKAGRFAIAAPFMILLVLALTYVSQDPPYVARALQATIPFMKYFRVAPRWGLLLPQFVGAILVLCWPELSAWVRQKFARPSLRARAFAGIFVVSAAFELTVLAAPRLELPPLQDSALQLLDKVKSAPGSTVLDLPFCLVGGNGMCGESCPNYPDSTVSGCLRQWHEKKVYGIYSARLVPSQCAYYNQEPYLAWFDAWKKQRCFTEFEWKGFCSYLEGHTELSAVLLYPDIWKGASEPACLREFEKHLGPALDQAEFASRPTLAGERPVFSRLLRYGTRCQISKSE